LIELIKQGNNPQPFRPAAGKERIEAMHKKRKCKQLEPVRDMPALHHSVEGQDFDINASEVVKWLMAQEGVKQRVFTICRARGLITFNPDTRTWSGATAPETQNKDIDHE